MRMNRPVVPRFFSPAISMAGIRSFSVISTLMCTLLCSAATTAGDTNKQLPAESWSQLTILNLASPSEAPITLNYQVCRMIDRRQNYQSPDRKETCQAEKSVTVKANGMAEVFARDDIRALPGGKEQDGGALYYIRVNGMAGGSGEQMFKIGKTSEKGADNKGAEYRDVLCLRRFLAWRKGDQFFRPNVIRVSTIHSSRAVVCEDSSPNIYPGLEDFYYDRSIPVPNTVSGG